MKLLQSNPLLILILAFLLVSCNGQNQVKSSINEPQFVGPERSTVKVRPNPALDPAIFCGFLDHEGIVWFGTTGNGVYRYNGESFTHLTEANGLCDNMVTSILEDQEGNLWFGTGKGLCRYDRKSFTHIPLPWSDTSGVWLDKVYPVVNPNQVMAMVQDKDGVFWIGSDGAGAYRYDGKTFTSLLAERGRKQEDSLYHNTVQGVTEDADGNIWFTSMTHGGASRYDGKTFTHFMPEDGLVYDMVRIALLDRTGNIWLGTLHHGISVYDGQSFTNFDETDGLCNNNVRCIYEDRSGQFWFGSGIGKTSIYDGTTFQEFRTKEGQTVDDILFVMEDAIGNIWLGGKWGRLYRFDGETLVDFTKVKGS